MTNDKNQFFRIAFGTQRDTALIISAKTASVVPFESPQKQTVLLKLRGHDRYFLSLEKGGAARRAQYTILCTSYEVIWVDESSIDFSSSRTNLSPRFSHGQPSLSWRHDFGAGRAEDLELCVIDTDVGGMSFRVNLVRVEAN